MNVEVLGKLRDGFVELFGFSLLEYLLLPK